MNWILIIGLLLLPVCVAGMIHSIMQERRDKEAQRKRGSIPKAERARQEVAELASNCRTNVRYTVDGVTMEIKGNPTDNK